MIRRPTSLTAAIAVGALALTSCGTAESESDPAASTPEQSPMDQETDPGAAGGENTGTTEEEPEADQESEDEDASETSDPETSEDGGSSSEEGLGQDESDETESEAFNPEDFSIDGVMQEPEQGSDIADLGDLTGVRHAVHEGYERLVFEFSADVEPNSFTLEFDDDPRLMMVDDPIEIPGDAALFFRVSNLHAGLPEDSPAGNDLLELEQEPYAIPESSVFTEVHYGGRTEAVGEYYIGVDTEREIRVEALEDPARIVIDAGTF